MSKITLLVFQRRANEALVALRKLGLVHIKHMQKPTAHHITDIEHKLAIVDRVIGIVSEYDGKEKEISKDDISSCLKEIVFLNNQKQTFGGRKLELEKRLVWFDTWGNVSNSSLAELKSKGVHIRLYTCDKKALKKLPDDRLIYVVGNYGLQCCIAHVSIFGEQVLDLPEVKAPSENLHSLQKKIGSTKRDLEITEKKLAKLALYKESFLRHKKELEKGLEFCKVKFGMNAEAGVNILGGFCPKESLPEIEKAAKEQGWAFVAEEPDDAEEVPTLIRNPKWINLIQPVFKFMGTLPGYGEYDISFWFFLFFSLFFAMLIGDAGYGAIFLIATFFMRRKFKTAPPEPFSLMYVLSIGTIIWGTITGTWFGAEKIAQLPVFSYLVVDRIDSFVGSNQNFMIHLCFFIGAIHLTIAHGIVAFKYINSVIALAQVGWMLMVWAIFFIASSLVLGEVLPGFALNLGAIGVGLVILFSNPRKNILKGMALSLAELPLKAIGTFSDVVSYLRLFAVGYATVAVASTFNNMALGSGISNILGGLTAALILLFGHALNIILGLMAVIVHGIRLNMLEFSGHLNMQWSGKEYKPFKD